MFGKFKGSKGPGKGTRKRKAREAKERAEEAQRRRREERDKGGSQATRGEVAAGDTAAERYVERRDAFVERFGALGRALHAGAWWAHNCVAHPVLGLLPGDLSLRLHDRTSDWLNLREDASHSPRPDITRRWAWVVHNCVAHPLIGVAPVDAFFAVHETTAEAMDVDGWV